jgi:hypothetical protein
MNSTDRLIPELVIAGPDSIVASIPFIIGFTPHNSLVVMWLRAGCVRLTMRLDLPPEDDASTRDSLCPWIDAVMAQCGSHDEVILCVSWSSDVMVRDAAGELRSRDLMGALLEELSRTDCLVRDALLVQADRWWSFLCEQPECCPVSGTPLDRSIANEVAARFAFAGVAQLPDRQAVLDTCAPDHDRQEVNRSLMRDVRRKTSARMSRSPDAARELESWREESISRVHDWLLAPKHSDSAHDVEVLVALRDIRVRDTVLWQVAQSRSHDAHVAFERAAELLRGAPTGAIAPIGTVTALLAWLIGDGVRAGAALDRVRDEDFAYPLADLLSRSIAAGLSAASWLEMMRGLTRTACRGL